jgi:hypothetical protein
MRINEYVLLYTARRLALRPRPCHHGGPSETPSARQAMSDIGSIVSLWDITVMLLVASQPGLLIGAALGAWRSPRGYRARGGLIGGVAGFALAFAGWWIYLLAIK